MENFNTKKQLLDNWNNKKYETHIRKEPPHIRKGEVWWCRMGENIGVEINGKNENSTRPVYVLKKLSAESALVIPLTSQKKKGSWYFSFTMKGRKQFAILSQIRTVSILRFDLLMGVLNEKIQEKLHRRLLLFLQ